MAHLDASFYLDTVYIICLSYIYKQGDFVTGVLSAASAAADSILSISIDFLETIQVEYRMGINLRPYSAYAQGFKFRSIVLPEISFDGRGDTK